MANQLTPIADKIEALDRALDAASVPHAFGGAIALAYATRDPRGTSDIDINVFVPSDAAMAVLEALPRVIGWSQADVVLIERDDQIRLWWDRTPVDLFFAAADFHRGVARRTRRVPFGEGSIDVLSAEDLATFKTLFNRTQDWADINTMLEDGLVELGVVIDQLRELIGSDPRIERLLVLLGDR